MITYHTPQHPFEPLGMQKLPPVRVECRALFQRLAIWTGCGVPARCQCLERPLEMLPNYFPSFFLATGFGKARQQPMAQQCGKATEQASPGEDHQIISVGIFYPIPMHKQRGVQIFPALFQSHGMAYQLVISCFGYSFPKLSQLAFSKAEQLIENNWVVVAQFGEHHVG